MTAELDRLMKPEVDRVNILRTRDYEIGTLVSDVVGYAIRTEDYKRRGSVGGLSFVGAGETRERETV